jgi:anti-sigma factor RsiW
MSCDQSQLLSAYLDGELPSAEAVRIEEHLATCPACSAEADELRALGRLMGMARRSDLGLPSQDVMGRLREHVSQLVETTDYGLLRIARLFTGLAATVLIAGLWLLHMTANQAPQAPTVRLSNHAPTPSAPVVDALAGVEVADNPDPSNRDSIVEKLIGVEVPPATSNIQAPGEDEIP